MNIDSSHDTSGTGAVVIQDELGIKHAALYLALIGLNKVKIYIRSVIYT